MLLSACFIGRRGRTLDRAVEHTYTCAAAEGYRYERLSHDRYRIHACKSPADKSYRHSAVFHCSRRRCASLSAGAQQYFSAATGCAQDAVSAYETADSAFFDVAGCNAQGIVRCEMRDQEVSCDPVRAIAPTLAPAVAPPQPPPAPAEPPTTTSETPAAPDAGAAP